MPDQTLLNDYAGNEWEPVSSEDGNLSLIAWSPTLDLSGRTLLELAQPDHRRPRPGGDPAETGTKVLRQLTRTLMAE